MGAHLLRLTLLSASLLISFAAGPAVAETFTVGEEDKWNSGINYLAWSQKHSFTVGDVLLFSYVKGEHDAYEVTEETYRSCDSSTGVIKAYTSGQDRVELTEARSYWFICNKAGHCLGGMKFGITVRAGNATAAPPLNGPGPQSPPPPAHSGALPRRGWLGTGVSCLLAAVGFLHLRGV